MDEKGKGKIQKEENEDEGNENEGNENEGNENEGNGKENRLKKTKIKEEGDEGRKGAKFKDTYCSNHCTHNDKTDIRRKISTSSS